MRVDSEIFDFGFILFILLSEACYAKTELKKADFVDEVDVSTVIDGDPADEFRFRWYTIDGKEVPRLEIYDEAWHLLPTLNPLFDYLASADSKNTTPKQVCQALMELGYEDITPRRKS